MKYTGRLCTMISLFIMESIYIIYYYNKFGYIKQNKCDIGQGYFFSHPLPAEDIIQSLEIN